ncbi:putative nucleolar protein 5-2 [Glycine max]|nr:putative nucleolar protein 5-2 [Glycine max]
MTKIDCIHNNAIMNLMRGVRNQLTELISGLPVQDMAPMSLGLSHSLSRYKLKFTREKVDTMIVQAIDLLDDLGKELNTYAMRVLEWYGWHFPELTKIIQDNILYARAVKLMGDCVNAASMLLPSMAAQKFKGKISRSLAAKTALAIRCDALGDSQDNTIGLENRAKLEARLRNLEGKELGRFAGSAKGKPKIEAYDKDQKKGAG